MDRFVHVEYVPTHLDKPFRFTLGRYAHDYVGLEELRNLKQQIKQVIKAYEKETGE